MELKPPSTFMSRLRHIPWTLCLCLVVSTVSTHKCRHSRLETPIPVKGNLSYHARHGERAAASSPIRISFFEDPAAANGTIITAAQRTYYTMLITQARQVLASALNVQPVQGNLFVPRNCSLNWISGPNRGSCAVPSTTNRCGRINIPQAHLGAMQVWPADSKPTYSLPAGVGISGADTLVYVQFSPDQCSDAGTSGSDTTLVNHPHSRSPALHASPPCQSVLTAQLALLGPRPPSALTSSHTSYPVPPLLHTHNTHTTHTHTRTHARAHTHIHRRGLCPAFWTKRIGPPSG